MDRISEMTALVSIVEEGSFTEAAHAMSVSRSTVSKLVQSLEARLSAKLLNRTTQSVILTEAGRAYYNQMRLILYLVDQLDATLLDSDLESRLTAS